MVKRHEHDRKTVVCPQCRFNLDPESYVVSREADSEALTGARISCLTPLARMILDVALNGEADAIITGDQDLLVLNPFHDIPILSPSEFLVQEPR